MPQETGSPASLFLTIRNKKNSLAHGKEATELSTEKYGAAEWWLLLEPAA